MINYLNQGSFRISAILYARNHNDQISIKQVIRKIIEDVLLHRCEDKCTISQIIEYVNEEHGIMLSEDEVSSIISDKKFQDYFIYYNDNRNPDYCFVSLTEKRRSHLKKEEKNKNLFDYIVNYVETHNLPKNYEETFKKFFYEVFATNLEGYIRLLKGENIIKEDEVNFTDEEKKEINNFLDWDNAEKNQAIFNFASYALEYCMLVNKKDSFLDVKNLKNKKLYLDTNILFRAIGVNGEDRKIRTEQFLSKFSQVQQRILITKETDSEFRDSINFYVDKLNDSFKPSCRVKPESFVKNVPIDGFYKNYCEWKIGKQNNSVDDYKIHLLTKYENVLKKYDIQKESIDPRLITEKESMIREYASSIRLESKDKQITASEIDAKNILWIEQKRKGENNDIYNVCEYLISSDQYLRRWDYRRNRNDVPIVMLPSQWLCLILRYMERTENDYKSFVNFLNIKISNHQLTEEQFFAVINGISEITSDIEQQNILIKTFIKDDFEKILQNNTDTKEIEENARQYAKTTLEQRIETLERDRDEQNKKLSAIQKNQNKTNEKIKKKQEEINAYKGQLKQRNNEIIRLKFDKWKNKRLCVCSLILLFNVLWVILYFQFQDFQYNWPAKVSNWINNLDGWRFNLVKTGLISLHSVLFLLPLSGIINLIMMKPEEERKWWLIKLICKQIRG